MTDQETAKKYASIDKTQATLEALRREMTPHRIIIHQDDLDKVIDRLNVLEILCDAGSNIGATNCKFDESPTQLYGEIGRSVAELSSQLIEIYHAGPSAEDYPPARDRAAIAVLTN